MACAKFKKTVFINTLYYPHEKGGAERSVRKIAQEHVHQGGQSIVITLSSERKKSISHHGGVKVYYVPVANISKYPFSNFQGRIQKLLWKVIDLYNPVMAFRVYKILNHEKPDIIETNNLQGFSTAVWAAAKYLGIPIVHVARDYYLSCHNSCMFKNGTACQTQCLSCQAFCSIKKHSSKNIKGLCGVSRKILDIHESMGYFPQKQYSNAVYSAVYSSLDAAPEAKTTTSNSSPLSIGFIGRHENIKGIEVLLKAVQMLDKKNYRFFIAGDGDKDYSAILKEKYSQENVEFSGWVSPDIFFSKIDFLVVPSLWEEPFGRVIAESYWHGVPVIAANNGGMPEAIEDGKTGFVFRAGDPQDLAKTLEKARNNSKVFNKSFLQEYSRSFASDMVYLRHKSTWDSVIQGAS